jgi:dTDP-4-dehydrorhamnose 3,5-epimerase-like enzyme
MLHLVSMARGGFDRFPGRAFLLEQSEVFEDPRGVYVEIFNHKELQEAVGHNIPELHFVQDDISISACGVLRGTPRVCLPSNCGYGS